MLFRRPAALIMGAVLLGGGLSAIATAPAAQAASAPIRMKIDGGKDNTVPRVSKVKPPKRSENPWTVKSSVRGTSVTNVDIVAGVQVYAQIRVSTDKGKTWRPTGEAASVQNRVKDTATANPVGVALPGRHLYAVFYTVDAVPTPAATRQGIRPWRQSTRGPLVWLNTPALAGDTQGSSSSTEGGRAGGWGGAPTPSIKENLPNGCRTRITQVIGVSVRGADQGQGNAVLDCPETGPGKTQYKLPGITPRVYMCSLPGDWRNRCPHWVQISLLPGKAGLEGQQHRQAGTQHPGDRGEVAPDHWVLDLQVRGRGQHQGVPQRR